MSSRSNTSGVSRSQYERSRAAGTTFQNRSQAESAFRQRNAGQFPSRYATQPSTRPNHIPQSTRVDGRNVNVTYNAGLGGYGYLHPTLGTWILYNAMTDAAMMSILMSRGGYYYGGAPGTYYGGGGGFFTGLILILLIAGVHVGAAALGQSPSTDRAARAESLSMSGRTPRRSRQPGPRAVGRAVRTQNPVRAGRNGDLHRRSALLAAVARRRARDAA